MSGHGEYLPKFGNQMQFAEPAWYQGGFTPYYNQDHAAFRAKCRKFVEEQVKPNIDIWVKAQQYPLDLHERCYEAGIQGMMYPSEYGGGGAKDIFYEVIACDEFARMGGGGVLGHNAINSMALPPIIKNGSQYLKDLVVRQVVTGKANISLAISEPTAGSDVAAIRCSAVRQGDYYIVNGTKKWITGGCTADFFTVAVKTAPDAGAMGISLLLMTKDMPGFKIRKMETQFDSSFSTAFLTFDDVKVPVRHLIGEENSGFMQVLTNFNHERLVIAVAACRMARINYEEAIMYAIVRKAFGKTLVQHQLVRFKLAEMARQIEALQDNIDRVAYNFQCGVEDWKMGGQCALLKVMASKTFEYCSREASQIFGGNSIIKEGKGKVVERLAREVRAQAIPGGSEEILLDFAIRSAVSKHKKAVAKGRARL